MRFRVLACDYDRTLATHGVTADAAVSALRAVSETGRKLVLVTGRVFDELLDVFSELDVFDRIVAENGGLLYDPATGGQRMLGPPVPSDLVATLRAAGLERFVVGRVMTATVTGAEPVVRDALARLELDQQLVFNKDSLMVLPPGVDKASGLAKALEDLGEQLATCVAAGDAENDIAMIDAAGVGVAVANALDELKNHADIVLERPNGEGIRMLCQALIDNDLASLLPAAPAEGAAPR